MSTAIIIRLQIQQGRTAEFFDYLKKILPDTRSYPGFINIDVYSSFEDPHKVIMYQVWQSLKHRQAYHAWREKTGVAEKISSFFASPPEMHQFEFKKSDA